VTVGTYRERFHPVPPGKSSCRESMQSTLRMLLQKFQVGAEILVWPASLDFVTTLIYISFLTLFYFKENLAQTEGKTFFFSFFQFLFLFFIFYFLFFIFSKKKIHFFL
jgi:hypothetical protein